MKLIPQLFTRKAVQNFQFIYKSTVRFIPTLVPIIKGNVFYVTESHNKGSSLEFQCIYLSFSSNSLNFQTLQKVTMFLVSEYFHTILSETHQHHSTQIHFSFFVVFLRKLLILCLTFPPAHHRCYRYTSNTQTF